MYSPIVYLLISCISIIYSFHIFINHLRIYYLLHYSFIRIYYLLYYSFICILLFIYIFNIHNIIYLYVFTIHKTIHLYVFYYSHMYSLFTIHHSPFTIHHSIFTIYYLGENSYLMEFDETPIFWYSRVARDALINLTFCSDQF